MAIPRANVDNALDDGRGSANRIARRKSPRPPRICSVGRIDLGIRVAEGVAKILAIHGPVLSVQAHAPQRKQTESDICHGACSAHDFPPLWLDLFSQASEI